VKRFKLIRDEDVTGISGTGPITEGVQFTDGTCVMRWLTEHRSTCFYDSVSDVEIIHGHEGRTRIEWIDD
jgi:hypothetical protein